ncbi:MULTISPECIES: ribosomal protein S18-alanine N-acetyltransferase [Syntrophotalea]|nr:ribosomal protein S18-alanine N-acetyltransferase [Syntrophotalea acetylenica]MDY0262096.1 ribosomal protein S18-alanine N-acetyltransferase [Syntrophotalea acetylenica]
MPGPASETYSIRSMAVDDLAAVVELERRCHVNPWSARLFEEELCRPHAFIDLLCMAGRIVGYACCWHVCDELHILNIAVDPACRRRGLGGMLLEYTVRRACQKGCERAFLEVRAGNHGAIHMYRTRGFETIGRRANYYADGEDAILMERKMRGD